MPEQDAVLVITSGVKDMQAVLTLVWDKLLPAFQDHALPDDPAAQETLKQAVRDLVGLVEGHFEERM